MRSSQPWDLNIFAEHLVAEYFDCAGINWFFVNQELLTDDDRGRLESPQGTAAVLRSWAKHPQWPALTVVLRYGRPRLDRTSGMSGPESTTARSGSSRTNAARTSARRRSKRWAIR